MKIELRRRERARGSATAKGRKSARRPARPLGGPVHPSVRVLGWCIHLYTALGLVAAALIAVLLVRGGAQSFRWSFILMLIATIIDSTDGAMARRIRITEVIPGFDGRKLDDLIDFL